MKRSLIIALGTFVAFFLPQASKQNTATTAYERLKSLAGEWQAKLPNGKFHKVLYEVGPSGTILIETLQPPDEPPMMSVYHIDGDKLAMTHYCSVGNQPRMSAAVQEGEEIKTLNFEFRDISNLTKPSQGHMRSLVITFKDKDHMRHEWKWHEDGKETANVFDFERSK